MDKKYDTGQIAEAAASLAMRIRWEEEVGVPGYGASTYNPAFPTTETVDNGEALSALRTELGDCQRCGLSKGRNNLVFGEGSANATLVFVGEGPGRDEDLAGRPFVGAAGQLLDRIITAMGLKRDEVYICNVVKCRPPGNRVPDEDERAVCGPFVRRQLKIINPKIVVALGGTAASYLLGRDEPLGRLRGRFHEVEGLKIMPTYHPAYLLRNPEGKKFVWQDIQMVMKDLGLEVESTGGKR